MILCQFSFKLPIKIYWCKNSANSKATWDLEQTPSGSEIEAEFEAILKGHLVKVDKAYLESYQGQYWKFRTILFPQNWNLHFFFKEMLDLS